MSKRIEYLDTAKGILILLMLLGHIWNDGIIHDFIYVFHMPAFFIITGILFNNSSSINKTLRENVISKAKTLLIPYLCFEIYAIVIRIMQYGMELNIKGYVYEMLTFNLTNGPLWFLIVLFLSEMLFLIYHKCIDTKYDCGMLSILFVAVLLLPKFTDYINITTVLTGLFFIVVGYKYQRIFCENNRKLIIITFLSVCVGTLNKGIGIPNYQDGNRLLFFGAAIAGTIFVIQIGQRITRKELSFFGENTLAILGSHYPIIKILKNILQIEEFSAGNGIVCWIVLVVLEIMIIYFINRFAAFVVGKSNRKKNI